MATRLTKNTVAEVRASSASLEGWQHGARGPSFEARECARLRMTPVLKLPRSSPPHSRAAPAGTPPRTHAASRAASAAWHRRVRFGSRGSHRATTATQRPARSDSFPSRLNHGAVRQLLQRHRQRVQPLPSAFQPLTVQHGVHFGRENVRNAIALFPRGAKGVGVVGAADRSTDIPAANEVASSRKNNSVQLRPPITLRRRPRNSQRK